MTTTMLRAQLRTISHVPWRTAFSTAVAVVLTVAAFSRKAHREETPARRAELVVPTATDGEIAVSNLDAEVRSYESRLTLAPRDAGLRRALVGLLLSRGDFLGCIADYERAEGLADRGVEQTPADPRAYRTRASVRSTFHRFDDALADLAEAQRLGTRPASLARERAGVLAAKGALLDALALSSDGEVSPDSMDLASRGLLYGELGRDAEARTLLERARAQYRDVSPFPLAWIDYHEGELAERRGDDARARALYVRAQALVPRYAAPAAHLARMVAASEGAAMAMRAAERSDDPEVEVTIATTLRALGRAGEADEHLRGATARYEELTARHRAAFADHAARFWLGLGNDPARAHLLAVTNLENRQTASAFDLALTTALVTGRRREACEIAARCLSSRPTDANVERVASAVAGGCAPNP